MDFKYVPESPGYEDHAKKRKEKKIIIFSVWFMVITLSELGS